MLSPTLFNTGVAECLDVKTVNHDNIMLQYYYVTLELL